ncbi:MAG: hypothetical protein K8R35_09175, partial [Bacteroidales bacterium]|nr:hypothetical protein [Bacteroidales bacterium]
MNEERRKGTGGGSATSAGMAFQHRVSAWIAVRILAEKDASPLWNLSTATTLKYLRCETEQPVDDLLIGTSNEGFIFCQIKHSLNLSTSAKSILSSVLEQFVRQFIAYRESTSGKRPWERPLDEVRDRLSLIIGPNSSAPIRIHLPSVLNRLRNLVPEQHLSDSAVNNEERRALSTTVDQLKRLWQKVYGEPMSDNQIRQVLSLIRVQVLDVDDGGVLEREAKDTLRTAILRHPDQEDTAWKVLISACEKLSTERSGADRLILQKSLLNAGIEVQAARSYQDEIARLKTHSSTTTKLLADLARIKIGIDEIKIKRPSTEVLYSEVEKGSILVAGEPGAGKSGALYDMVQILEAEGKDVIFLAVDKLTSRSLQEIRTELGLEHDFIEVIANWPGTKPAFLVLDALDAARADQAAQAFLDLIKMVVEAKNRWSVVASIRKFDLRYNQELQKLFSGVPCTKFIDEEFNGICHINIPKLSDEELFQIAQQSSDLQTLIHKAPPECRDLLRVPFNLRLMAELIGSGVPSEDLTPIRTQLELLDRYWMKRVVRSNGHGDAREIVLRRVCEEMVKTRTLRVDRSCISEPSITLQLTDLLSLHVLTEWQPSEFKKADRYILTFSHHVLFDYAVARLLLRGSSEELIGRLSTDPELTLMVRPSLLIHFRHLWMLDGDHKQFWDIVLNVMQADKIPEIGKLIGPTVAANLAMKVSDLDLFCTAIEETDSTIKNSAEKALRH